MISGFIVHRRFVEGNDRNLVNILMFAVDPSDLKNAIFCMQYMGGSLVCQ